MTTSVNASTPAAVPAAPARRRLDIHVLVFRAVAVAMSAFLLSGPGGAAYLPAPWRIGEPDPTISFELHRWHVTDISAFVALLLVGLLVASAVTPRRSAPAAQSFVTAAGTLAVAGLFTSEPAMILVPCVALAVIFLAAYPGRRELLRRQHGERSFAALAAAGVATPYLLVDAGSNIVRQVTDTSQHGELGHWAIGAVLSLVLLLAGWLAATSGRAGRPLRAALGVTYLYLATAALSIPHHDGSWSFLGGAVACVAGAGFLAAGIRRRHAAGAGASTCAGG
jgi:hypothetical protein